MNRQGFTLVEILIVVIILGILAAIVIPQFTEASNDARTSALNSDWQSVTAQIELYRMQHLGKYPGDDWTTGSAVAEDMRDQLTQKTTTAGAVGSGSLGPYLSAFPSNPFVSDPTDAIAIGGLAGEGWGYDKVTGKLTRNVTQP